MNFSQNKTLYSKRGRMLVGSMDGLPPEWVVELVNKSRYVGGTVEYVDNRISHYMSDGGKCYVTGLVLKPSDVHCHHKTPRKDGGGDDYNNLCLVHKTVHKLIHGTNRESIAKWLEEMRISKDQLKKLNHLRQLVGNDNIAI